MASNVEVILNFPRTELKRDGWAKSRLASSMKPVKLVTSGGNQSFKASALPDELWREPNTGVILLKPTPLKANFWEDTSLVADRLPLDKWDHESSSTAGLMAVAHNDSMLTMRTGRDDDCLIPILVDIALLAIRNLMLTSLVWVMKTKDPFAPNEGFSVWVHPPGVYTDRATDYMLIAFGQKYVLHLRMNGTASLWTNTGTLSVPQWIEKVTFKYASGGVDHSKPFQITVIPWGFGYITFLFSQANEPGSAMTAGVRGVAKSRMVSYLYDIAKHEGNDALEYDSTSEQFIKTKQGHLHVALRGVLWQYGFAWSRVRYPASGTLLINPEHLPEPYPQAAPDVDFRGFSGQIPPNSTPTGYILSYTDEANQAWNPTIDTQIVNKVVMTSSGNRMYTPELWSLDMEIPVETHTPNWTPSTYTDWTLVRFQRNAEMDVSGAELKFENDSLPNIFRGWGPVRIKVEGVTVYDGYITYRQPTIEPWVFNGLNEPNTKAAVTTQITCQDMWLRLNERKCSNFKFLDGLNLLETIKALIKRGGWLESDIEVSADAQVHLSSIEIEGFVDPNDQKGINQEGTCGDVLRELLRNYSLLPIRVRYVGDKWVISLAPQYDPETPPTKKFYLKSDHASTLPDVDRWANDEYWLFTSPELTIEEPAFNGLIAKSVEGSSEDAEGIQAVIPATKIDSDSVTNEDSFWFMGRAKIREVAPPEITMAQTRSELAKIARVFWDRYSKHKPVTEVLGEWRPSIDVDQFIWIIGVNEIGARVSYGAWRIEAMDVEGHEDWPDADRRWTWRSNYTLVYVGEATDAETPMFTSVLPPA